MAPEIIYGGNRYDAKVCSSCAMLSASLAMAMFSAALTNRSAFLIHSLRVSPYIGFCTTLACPVACRQHDASMDPADPAHIAAQKADIWSCGVILYAMLYGCYPFSNKEQDYIRKIVTASYHLPSDISVRVRCWHSQSPLLAAGGALAAASWDR